MQPFYVMHVKYYFELVFVYHSRSDYILKYILDVSDLNQSGYLDFYLPEARSKTSNFCHNSSLAEHIANLPFFGFSKI